MRNKIKEINGRPAVAWRDFISFAEIGEKAGRYLGDQCRDVSKKAGREPIKINGFTAYYLAEIAEAFDYRRPKISRNFGEEVAAAVGSALSEMASAEKPAEKSEEPKTAASFYLAENKTRRPVSAPKPAEASGEVLREAIAALSNERAKTAALSLENENLREMANKSDDHRRAAAIARRDLDVASAEIKRLEKIAGKRKNGAAVLAGVFSSPVFLFAPLLGIIGASFAHMGIVFSAAFPSAGPAWIMAAVFSSVVLVFTFNSKGRAGAGFAAIFAAVEFLVNGVYFGFLPASIVPAVAAVSFPVALLAYTHLFTNKTKTSEN